MDQSYKASSVAAAGDTTGLKEQLLNFFLECDSASCGIVPRTIVEKVFREYLSQDDDDTFSSVLDRMTRAGNEGIDYTQFVDWICSDTSPPEAGCIVQVHEHATPAPGLPGDPLRGLSVHFLQTEFLADLDTAGFCPDACVYDIKEGVILERGKNLTCPRDGRQGCAYVDCLTGKDNAGSATAMLSYTWGYMVKDIVDALGYYCSRLSLDTKRFYIWICCLCINQHRVQEAKSLGTSISFNEFAEAFGSRVAGIGHILALMEPWQSPHYVTRVWCIFELHKAEELADKCKLEILMPPREVQNFAKAVLDCNGTGLNQLWQTLANIAVEQAKASEELDKTNILHLVSQKPGGFGSLNDEVRKKLKLWFVSSAISQAREMFAEESSTVLEAGDACGAVSVMLFNLGEMDRARELLDHAIQKMCSFEQLGSFTGACLLRKVGVVKWKSGDLTGALVSYDHSRRIFDDIEQINTEEGANLLMNMGIVKDGLKDYEKAMDCYLSAQRIREETQTLSTTDGASLLKNMGLVKRHLGDQVGALEYLNQAFAIRRDVGSLGRPDGAALLENVGRTELDLGHLGDALEHFDAALVIRSATNTLDTAHGARLFESRAVAASQQGNLLASLDSYTRAWGIRKRTGTLDTVEGTALLKSMGDLWRKSGNVVKAEQCFTEAKHIYREIGLEKTAGAAELAAAAEECDLLWKQQAARD